MKHVIYFVLLASIFSLSVYAQPAKSKGSALPAGIAGWSGEYSDKLLKNAVIKARLKKLMGSTSYAAFMESFETLTPITKKGDVLFASGCLTHACGHLESAIAIDIKNNTVHAAIFDEEKPTRFFNERGRSAPASIVGWAKNLDQMKVDK